MVWQPGTKLKGDRYTIDSILGGGRFGFTYLARDRNGNRVVIKTPNDEIVNRADFDRLQEVFVREAVKLAKCNNPHIVKTKDPFKENGLWCLPMEYIDGTNLDRIGDRVLPEAEALRYVRQIGKALKEVHKLGFLHRDVRPENIILRRGEQNAVLIDFGLAREIGDSLTATRSEEISKGFSPLELYSSKAKPDARTDIYALGATLYDLLTGTKPPDASDRKTSGAQLQFPAGMNPKIAKAIAWAMQLEMDDRPASVEAWLKRLPKVNQKGAIVVPEEKEKSFDRQFKIWSLVLGILTAIGVLIGIFADLDSLFEKTPSNPTPPPTNNP